MAISLNEINLSTAKSFVKSKLLNACKSNESISKINEYYIFFNSTFWKDFKERDLDGAHTFAIEYLTQLLGADKFAIFDNGTALYDTADMYSKLTDNQKLQLNLIDSNKLSGIYLVDGVLMMHIGTIIIQYQDQEIMFDPVSVM